MRCSTAKVAVTELGIEIPTPASTFKRLLHFMKHVRLKSLQIDRNIYGEV